jgi:hemerythrin-like domain-containing protein
MEEQSMIDDKGRRFLLTAAAGIALAAADPGRVRAAATPGTPKEVGEKEVGAVEDLMREHGVLRRALLVYRECATRLRSNRALVDPRAIVDAARLFRSFGENYHEKKLEEAHIFPAVRKAGGAGARYVDVLIAQHQRGREITDYILAVAGKGTISGADAEPLARVFDSMDLMYENHAAREDTIVFPAWKAALSERQLDEMGDLFEDIERAEFGHDGFEDAVARIGHIEAALGLADITQFTAPPPPKA